MTRKLGTLRRIASKTLAAGREHAGKLLKGEETLPEAAGAAVEDLFTSPKAKSASQAAEKVRSQTKAVAKKKPIVKAKSVSKKKSTVG